MNLWEFDVAEVWYADGRMQLQGANESGKSTLMTLTTLVLLDGAVYGRNIDTLGEAGKKFRYYVEPSDHPLDRRDGSKQRHRGWTWVEYGRAAEPAAEFFTTMLCAETRRGDPEPKLQWCTLYGERRVRDGVTLASAGLPTEPGQLRDVPGLTLHRTATSCREETARVLFGAGTGWLDQLVRMLRVIRTPKIGDRLDLDFLRAAFRQALPPLAEDEINQLAGGWEQLDRLRKEKDNAEQALAAIAEFTRHRWRPWADAVIRAAADPVIAANDDLDNITRQERASARTATQLAERVDTAEQRLRTLAGEREEAQARREALQQERAYQDAVAAATNARHLTERASEAQGWARTAADNLAETKARLAADLANHEEAQRRLAAAEQLVTDAAERVAGRAEPAGLADPTNRFLPERDVARLRHAAQRRSAAAEQAIRLWDDHHAVAREAEAVVREADNARRRADESRERAERAERRVEAEVTAVIRGLAAWTASVPEPLRPASRLVEEWGRRVAGIVDADAPEPVLTAAVANEHLLPVRRPLDETRARLSHGLTNSRAEHERVEGELAAVEAERDPVPREPEL